MKAKRKIKNVALVFSVIASAFIYLAIAEQGHGSYTIPQMIGMGAILLYLMLFAVAQI